MNHPLRKLAMDMLDLLHKSEYMTLAGPIIHNAADHLCAIARLHELNKEMNNAEGSDGLQLPHSGRKAD